MSAHIQFRSQMRKEGFKTHVPPSKKKQKFLIKTKKGLSARGLPKRSPTLVLTTP